MVTIIYFYLDFNKGLSLDEMISLLCKTKGTPSYGLKFQKFVLWAKIVSAYAVLFIVLWNKTGLMLVVTNSCKGRGWLANQKK